MKARDREKLVLNLIGVLDNLTYIYTPNNITHPKASVALHTITIR